jgi:hypothetical protein
MLFDLGQFHYDWKFATKALNELGALRDFGGGAFPEVQSLSTPLLMFIS